MSQVPSAAPRARDLLLAACASACLVLLAPAIGEFRRWLRLTFPAHFAALVTLVTALVVVAALGRAAWRIGDRRLPRLSALACAVALGLGYARLVASGTPDADVVERVHFVEYGLVTWLFYRAWAPLGDGTVVVLSMLCALTVGTCEEWLEWFVPARVGELRDIFLNGAAILSGVLFAWALRPLSSLRLFRAPRALSRTCLVTAIAAAALAGFVDTVHVGYEIRDASGRTFRSIYAADRLLAIAAVRAETWRASPPLDRPARFSREDQYASEGLLHVQARNTRWAEGDAAGALDENAILDAFFAPVLDAPSYVSRTGHRWPAEQLADARRRAAGHDPARFVSRAQGAFPIFTIGHTAFRAVAAAIVCVLLAGFVVTRRLDYPVSGGARR